MQHKNDILIKCKPLTGLNSGLTVMGFLLELSRAMLKTLLEQ